MSSFFVIATATFSLSLAAANNADVDVVARMFVLSAEGLNANADEATRIAA